MFFRFSSSSKKKTDEHNERKKNILMKEENDVNQPHTCTTQCFLSSGKEEVNFSLFLFIYKTKQILFLIKCIIIEMKDENYEVKEDKTHIIHYENEKKINI